MFMSVISGLVVSVDAFFIGLSLGLQARCKFMYLVLINSFLLGLCILGFMVAGRVYELIAFDADLVVGFAFIALGLWCIIQYFLCEYLMNRRGGAGKKPSCKTIAAVGFMMSAEAMIITMGITFIFLPGSTFLIPISVAFAHFGYSAFSFKLARTKYVRGVPAYVSHVVSGMGLIVYGLMALFVEIGV